MFQKNKYICLSLLAVLVVSTTISCATPAPKEKDENFLGDFNPVQLENLMALTYNSVSGIKPLEVRAYLVPRTNTVELYFRILTNEIALVLDKQTRDLIKSSAEQYLSLYESDSLKRQNPSKKNAYVTGTMSLGWGLINAYRYTEAPFWTNYKIIDEKPYFMLYCLPTPDVNDSSAYSPLVEIYFSPSLLHDYLELAEQENLKSIVDEFNTKAYTFE